MAGREAPARRSVISWSGGLDKLYADQSVALVERAAGSEDAFDAAVSVLEMAAHQWELRELRRSAEPDYAIEGRIWAPKGTEALQRVIPIRAR